MKRVIPTSTAGLRWAGTSLVSSIFALSIAACNPNTPASTAAPSRTAAKGDAAAAAAKSMEGMPGMSDMDHSKMMTPAQMAELREKIPLYGAMSDEDIMTNMTRMPPDFWGLISSKDMQGTIGVLALGHGYKLGGNEQFENYAQPISKEYPTAVAPGMAMMSSAHIQQAVDELTSKHGVKTIVVVPMEPGDDTSLIHQWQYIFGLREGAPYLTVPRVRTEAKVVFTKSPAADSRISTIMRDYAIEASAHPDKDRLILVSHGPEDPKDNPAELKLLENHATSIRKTSNFKDIKVVSLEDDAVPPIRAAHVAELRGLIKEATDKGLDVVIVPMILTKGGFHARLQKDLAGLNYKFANKGLIEHPAFQGWISNTVREGSSS